MRAYAEETNGLNRERRSNSDAWKAELVKVEKQIRGIIEAIKAGMFHESMKAEMDALEARKKELSALLVDIPNDVPDMLARAAGIYASRSRDSDPSAEPARGKASGSGSLSSGSC
ncbi:hypothetical protein MWN34_19455 [Ancylobacter sp. 6x-1]|uniref:Uncharacterized protein n=1 Tax=Ancylobacter crimeensis TaxID=2579147 RepID=A0ABT0DGI9_9HYPH|nr:hypothetical protein [Ancylobacter crimeensis]MCK0199080.1 hypothetical protein [Ancylobacter crimeensis]